MMISSRQKKDSYEANSVPAPAGKYAGASWNELGMLNLLALPAHKRKNMPALLAPKKYKILTTRKALVGFSLSLSLSLSHTHTSPQLLDYTHTHKHTHKHTHTCMCMHAHIHSSYNIPIYIHALHTYIRKHGYVSYTYIHASVCN
jgi:hypothetical protein